MRGDEGRTDCKFCGSVRPMEPGLKVPLALHEAGVLETSWPLSKTGTSKYQRSLLHLSIGCHSNRYKIGIGYWLTGRSTRLLVQR